MANHAPTPIQSSIPLDLERRISELHVEYSSHTGINVVILIDIKATVV